MAGEGEVRFRIVRADDKPATNPENDPFVFGLQDAKNQGVNVRIIDAEDVLTTSIFDAHPDFLLISMALPDQLDDVAAIVHSVNELPNGINQRIIVGGYAVKADLVQSIRHGQACVSSRNFDYFQLNLLPRLPSRFHDLNARLLLNPAPVRRLGRFVLAAVIGTNIWMGIAVAIDSVDRLGLVGLAQQAELSAVACWLIYVAVRTARTPTRNQT